MTPSYVVHFGVTVVLWIVIGSGVIQMLVQIAQAGIAAFVLHKTSGVHEARHLWQRYRVICPPVAIIVPAYNEGKNIVDTVHSLMALRYPDFEVIVVNDGSTDNTLPILTEMFELQPAPRPVVDSLQHMPVLGTYLSRHNPRLLVVDKVNGGKADAQNAGLAFTSAELFCAMDGDSILEADALIRSVRPFMDDPEQTIAVGGTIRIANGSQVKGGQVVSLGMPTSIIALFQIAEYMRAFLMARVAWSSINALLIVSGAFGLFRRRDVVDVGGYTCGSMGEDLDLVLKLHSHMLERGRAYRVCYLAEPVCWTEAPETLTVLARQRRRWQRGAIECFVRHRRMLFNPTYGRVGVLGMGQMLVVDIVGPVAETLGYLTFPLLSWLDLLDTEHMLAFLALVFAGGVSISVSALILEELYQKRLPNARAVVVMFAVAILENFGYRQLNNVWRLQGLWQYWRGNKTWGSMPRKGLSS